MEAKYDKNALREYIGNFHVMLGVMKRDMDEGTNQYNLCKQEYSRIYTECEEESRRAYNRVATAESEIRMAEVMLQEALSSASESEDSQPNYNLINRAQAMRMHAEADLVQAETEYTRAQENMSKLNAVWEKYRGVLEDSVSITNDSFSECAIIGGKASEALEQYIGVMDKAHAALYDETGSSNGNSGNTSSGGMSYNGSAGSISINETLHSGNSSAGGIGSNEFGGSSPSDQSVRMQGENIVDTTDFQKGLFCGFETDQHINGSQVFVKGENYDQFKNDYYSPEETAYTAYDTPKEIFISPSMIEGIHLGKREAEDSSIFWSQHEKGGTAESFRDIARHIPEIREGLANGLTLAEISEDSRLSDCVSIYFVNKPKVVEHDGYYEFDTNGRHRILAARSLGYDIPVEVIGYRGKKEGNTNNEIISLTIRGESKTFANTREGIAQAYKVAIKAGDREQASQLKRLFEQKKGEA